MQDRLKEENKLLNAKWEKEKNITLKWRNNIKVGSDSNCGLVVSVKKPIAEIQTNIGVKWIKIAQLYPSGSENCYFSNGRYLQPSLPY